MVDSIENFIVQVLGKNNLNQDSFVDISDKNIKIQSFDEKTGKIEYQKINKIIRKKDAVMYKVYTLTHEIKVTKEHKFFIKLDKKPFYLEVNKILKLKGNIYILTDNDWEPLGKIEKLGKEEVYDLEVEKNNNLFTNGILSHNSMTSGDVSTGGNAWKFYADMRWKVWKLNDKENDLNKTTVDIIKNKLAAPFGQAKINVLWGIGYDTLGEIIDYAVEFDLIKKGGSWFTFREEKFQGTDNVKAFLNDNPEILEYLKTEVLNRLNNE